jgi:hypothetical protein
MGKQVRRAGMSMGKCHARVQEGRPCFEGIDVQEKEVKQHRRKEPMKQKSIK